jgi:hypothetical protein
MGLLLSKEEAREKEVVMLIGKTEEQYWALQAAVAAERAAGIPPVAGTKQVLRSAVSDHLWQLWRERRALLDRKCGC